MSYHLYILRRVLNFCIPLQFWDIGEIPSLISTPEEDSSSRKTKTFQPPYLSEKEYSQ